MNVLPEHTYSVAIPIDTSGSVTINMDTLSGNDKSGMVILESNRVRVVTPIVEVV
jgi:hypothetical protein